MKTYTNHSRSIWYDPKIERWTLRAHDSGGKQVGSLEHVDNRYVAASWLYSAPESITQTALSRMSGKFYISVLGAEFYTEIRHEDLLRLHRETFGRLSVTVYRARYVSHFVTVLPHERPAVGV